jgi:predicted phosphodiesterase
VRDRTFENQASVKFCFVGDVGLDTPVQLQVAQALSEENCDRVYFLGDIIYPNGIQDQQDPLFENNFLRYYRPLYEQNPQLQLNIILGNHDYAANAEAWFAIARQNKNIFFPTYYYMEDFGGMCIVSLDTNLLVYREYIPESLAQVAWLEKNHKRINKCKTRIAVSHHPYKGGGYPGSLDWTGSQGVMKRFLKKWVIGKMDLHIAGHVHILEDDGESHGTRMLISGTGGEVETGASAGYIVVEFSPQEPEKYFYAIRKIEEMEMSIKKNIISETGFSDDNQKK